MKLLIALLALASLPASAAELTVAGPMICGSSPSCLMLQTVEGPIVNYISVSPIGAVSVNLGGTIYKSAYGAANPTAPDFDNVLCVAADGSTILVSATIAHTSRRVGTRQNLQTYTLIDGSVVF